MLVLTNWRDKAAEKCDKSAAIVNALAKHVLDKILVVEWCGLR